MRRRLGRGLGLRRGAAALVVLLLCSCAVVPGLHARPFYDNSVSTQRTTGGGEPATGGFPLTASEGPAQNQHEGDRRSGAPGYGEEASRERKVFNPTYEWQQVLDDVEVPGGLEISLGLDGRGKFARIPQPWQLQIDLGKDIGFLRMMVTAFTQVLEIKNGAALKARVHSHCINFIHYGTGFDGRALSDWETVGDVYWFHYRTLVLPSWGQGADCVQLPKPHRKFAHHQVHEEV